MHSMLFDLTGKIALVTGSTRGMGLAIAEELGRYGAQILISSEDPADTGETAARLRQSGLEALGIACDVADRTQVSALVEQAHQLKGRIDILVCSAGVAPHFGPLADATDTDWEVTMTINLRSMLWLTSLVIPEMAQRKDGSVILMSSLSGIRGNRALGLYSLSKAGVAQLARNLAVEWGASNVRVNAISPGVIETSFAKPITDRPDALAKRIGQTPLRRVGQPHEIAGVAVLLAGRGGAFITGQNIIVDGGTIVSDGS